MVESRRAEPHPIEPSPNSERTKKRNDREVPAYQKIVRQRDMDTKQREDQQLACDCHGIAYRDVRQRLDEGGFAGLAHSLRASIFSFGIASAAFG